jgi:hypothetical protein
MKTWQRPPPAQATGLQAADEALVRADDFYMTIGRATSRAFANSGARWIGRYAALLPQRFSPTPTSCCSSPGCSHACAIAALARIGRILLLSDLAGVARSEHSILAGLPRKDRDPFIAPSNGHVLAFDNVLGLAAWISDTRCRLATGGAFRPVIPNGIEDVVTRPDLADRAVFLTLEPIPEERRRRRPYYGPPLRPSVRASWACCSTRWRSASSGSRRRGRDAFPILLSGQQTGSMDTAASRRVAPGKRSVSPWCTRPSCWRNRRTRSQRKAWGPAVEVGRSGVKLILKIAGPIPTRSGNIDKS